MRVAVCTIAYNEAEHIERCINQFKPWGLRHVVLVSTKPWNGTPTEYDGTVQIAERAGAEVIVGYWSTEAEQRNYGLAMLRDYDWILIVDADELYSQTDIAKLISTLSQATTPAARTNKMVTYWKTTDYVFDPADGHEPIIAVNPKKALFSEHRQIRQFVDHVPEFSQELIPVTIHHMSWVKSDAKVKEKIQSFSHADQIRPGWYEEVWLKWTPEMENIRPYGRERSQAVKKPAPMEIMQYFNP